MGGYSCAARHDDADSRSLGRQSADGRRAPRLLRIPRGGDGAVGRPGRRGLYRRPPDRRHAGPQRPASGALSGHRRRYRPDGLGNGRADLPGREDRQEMAPATGQDVPHRPSSRAASSTTRSSRRPSPPPSPIASGSRSRAYFLDELPEAKALAKLKPPLLDAQQAFGYSQEDVKFILEPMVHNGEEATGSMGTDTALPVLSNKNKSLYIYFKQLFAQVTNPPIDPIREEIVMSLTSLHRPEAEPAGYRRRRGKPDAAPGSASAGAVTDDDCARLRDIDKLTTGRVQVAGARHHVPGGRRRGRLRARRYHDSPPPPSSRSPMATTSSSCPIAPWRPTAWPIPALLACAGVHHHLVTRGLRTSTGLVVDSGSVREVHHFALLAGYGAEAVCPWLTFATIEDMAGLAASRIQGWPQELHQGDRQGSDQGDVQDGHLHLPVLLRRADLRSHRSQQPTSSSATSPARRPRSKASASPKSPRRLCVPIAAAFGSDPVLARHARRRR